MTESSEPIEVEGLPEADRIEQVTEVYADQDDEEAPPDVPLEADPADTLEQHREVPADDDYPHE